MKYFNFAVLSSSDDLSEIDCMLLGNVIIDTIVSQPGPSAMLVCDVISRFRVIVIYYSYVIDVITYQQSIYLVKYLPVITQI